MAWNARLRLKVKVITRGRRPQLRGNKVIVTTGNPCLCGDCGGGGTGACCVNGECSILSAADCLAAAGYYFGNGTDCSDDPCTLIGCCLYLFEGSSFCTTTTPEICDTIPGSDFSGFSNFCWPEGDVSGIPNNCCLVGELACGSHDAAFCCNPDVGESCCPIIEACCPAGQVCSEEDFGCIPAPIFDDPFFRNN